MTPRLAFNALVCPGCGRVVWRHTYTHGGPCPDCRSVHGNRTELVRARVVVLADEWPDDAVAEHRAERAERVAQEAELLW